MRERLDMAMSEGLRNILNIIAELSGRIVSKSVRDTAVIQRSGLPGEEVRSYFSSTKRIRLFPDGHQGFRRGF
jgi:hypothetical protein